MPLPFRKSASTPSNPQPMILRAYPRLAAIPLCLLTLTLASPAQQPEPASPPTPKPQTEALPPEAPAIPHRQSIAASDAYLAGARALEHNDLPLAETHFAQAARLDPANHDYTQALTLTREHHLTALVQQAAEARLHGRSATADALLTQARTLDPQNTIITQHTAQPPRPAQLDAEPWITQGPALAEPISLQPDPTTKSLHLKGDAQAAITQLTQTFGIKAVFDPSAPRQNLRFDLENTTYAQASPILYSMAHVFAVPLDAKTLFFARDTADNRQRLERQVQETLYVPGQTIEQLNELGTLIRNLFDVKQLTVQQGAGSLVLRAPGPDIKAINLTLADLLDGGAEVLVELKLYSVDISKGHDIGFQPPQFGAYNVTAAAQAIVSANQTLIQQAISQGLISSTDSVVAQAFKLIASGLVSSSLLSSTIAIFGGSINPTTGAVSSIFTTGITTSNSFTLNLSANSSDARALEDVQVRVGDRQPANFRAGMRYPITTSTYQTPSASSLAGVSVNGTSAASLLASYLGTASTTTIPQISYEDLGLTLKVTPNVQKSGRVAMKLDLKIESLAGSALNNIPILASRTLTSDITVNESETAMLVSTVSKSESSAVTGLPGLSELPGFQIPTEQNVTRDSSELIILITPHVVRHRAQTLAGPRIAVSVPPSSRIE